MSEEKSEIWDGFTSNFFETFGEESLEEMEPGDDKKTTTEENRMILNMIFVIDVSGSMRGTRIAQVNYALENIFKEMKKRDDLNSVIKVGIMEFSDDARWKTAKPIPMDDFIFTPINVQKSFTCYASAFDALEKKLHKNEFMNTDIGEYYSPLILFITDGEPVDVDDYPKALERLQQNKWFKKSAKYAIAVGEEAKNSQIGNLLSGFTGVKENVRYADEGVALCNLIEFITVRASEVQTSMVSSTYGGGYRDDSIFSDVDGNLFSSLFRS